MVGIMGGSVSILNPPPPHGFLNSDRQVSEVFAADRKSSVKAPRRGANRRNWVGMLPPDPPVTASQFVVAGGFLARSLLLPLHPLLLRQDKIYGEEGGGTPRGLGFSLSGSPALSAEPVGRGGG